MSTCNRPLYARPDDATVRCECGARYDVGERRAWMRDAAREVVLTRADMLRAIPELVGEDLAYKRLSKWIERGKLVGRGPDMAGRETYLVGDVMDLMEGKTVVSEEVAG